MEDGYDKIKREDGFDNYENGHFRAPGPNPGHYPAPPHSQAGPYPGYQGGPHQALSQAGQGNVTPNGDHAPSSGPGQYSNKCGRQGCRNYIPGHSEYCSSDCVMGKCEEVYDSWSSCMIKNGPAPGHAGPNPDVMVK